MKIISKNALLLLVANSLVMSCAVSNSVTNPASQDKMDLRQANNRGNVKFRLDFPAKFTNNQITMPKGFSIKTLDAGKINRVKIKIEAITVEKQPFVLERNVDLVPGGIEATLSLPLNKLYTVTVQGLNDTSSVSGAEIKGYFSLMSSSQTPTVEVSQSTTPIAKIIEGLRLRINEFEDNTDNNALGTVTIGKTTGGTIEKPGTTTDITASPTPSASPAASTLPTA